MCNVFAMGWNMLWEVELFPAWRSLVINKHEISESSKNRYDEMMKRIEILSGSLGLNISTGQYRLLEPIVKARSHANSILLSPQPSEPSLSCGSSL
jgi:hypothetical protein